MTGRGVAFSVLCASSLLLGGVLVARATFRARGNADRTAATDVVIGPSMLVFARVDAQTVMVAPLDAPNHARDLGLRCDRVHFAANRGICLVDTRTGIYPPAIAIVFDEHARELARFDLAGVPSRARISRGGRYAAATVFVQGESYDSPLGMSTRTTIMDLRTKTVVGELERFTVAPDGRPERQAEFNFWGVTFTGDDGRFYATLGVGQQTYLVAGDVASRSMRIVRTGVECPSLSPDGRRIAYKRRLPEGGWRLHVLDLAGMRDRPLAEPRSFDDQAEWLDDRTIIYGYHEQSIDERSGGVAVNIWQLAVDDDSPPHRLVAGGFSPAVVR